jgi:hypothetical protein
MLSHGEMTSLIPEECLKVVQTLMDIAGRYNIHGKAT